MILTCPECSSRYFVDDARVGPKGRSVRCAGCGHTWRATAGEGEAPLALDFPGDADAAAGRDAPLPERIRAEALEKKRTREAVAAGVAWAGIGAGFIAVALAAVLFRVDVVRLFPKTAEAYAFARMPVNSTGLALEKVQGLPNLIDGRAALTVSGVERNIEAGPRSSMPLRVILYDKDNKRLVSAVSAPPARLLAAGESRPFVVNFIDPPTNVNNFEVDFAFDKVALTHPRPAPAPAPGRALPARPHPPEVPGGRGPEAGSLAAPTAGPELPGGPAVMPGRAEEARPLPSNSPYALPPSALQPSAH